MRTGGWAASCSAPAGASTTATSSLLARWAAEQNWDFRKRLAGGDEERAREMEPGDVGFSLSEALNHVDEIEDLPDEAKRRIKAFSECVGCDPQEVERSVAGARAGDHP